ncbi:MAG: hypothetical protein WBC88_02125 [Candidatus Zixiibacteriota bacterium]
MKTIRNLFKNKNAAAWVLMISAIAVHVLDEAITGFLPFYNDVALNLRASLGLSLPPTFAFETWLGGLIAAIIVCFSLTPAVSRGGRFIRVLTTALGILMVANALGHMLGSFYSGRLLPGFWSSPFLLVTAVYVVIRGFSGAPPIAKKVEG